MQIVIKGLHKSVKRLPFGLESPAQSCCIPVSHNWGSVFPEPTLNRKEGSESHLD